MGMVTHPHEINEGNLLISLRAGERAFDEGLNDGARRQRKPFGGPKRYLIEVP
jgi:hypothetical protein